MSGVTHIRDVFDMLRRRLKAHAGMANMSRSDYLLVGIRHVGERPTLDELRARLGRRTEAAPVSSPAETVRVERGPI